MIVNSFDFLKLYTQPLSFGNGIEVFIQTFYLLQGNAKKNLQTLTDHEYVGYTYRVRSGGWWAVQCFFLYAKKNVNLIYIPLHCTDIEPEVALHITRSRQCNKFYEQREKAALYLFSSYCILHFYKYCFT